MSFLSAMFLIGAAAIAAPVFIHMIRRAPRNNFQFSTLRFLNPSPEVVATRSRVQHWLLLVLRALVILLIAFAFARPYFVSTDEMESKQKDACVLFLVDTSASMQRPEIQEELQKKLQERISLLKNTDHAALVFFSSKKVTQVSFKKWQEWTTENRKDLILASIKNIKSDWGESKLAECLIQSAEMLDSYLDEAGLAKADIELFSDAQEGASLESLKRYTWPSNIKLINNVVGNNEDNASLHFIALKEDKSELKLRVSNDSALKAPLQIKLEIKGRVYYENKLTLEPEKSRILNVPLSSLPPGTESLEVKITGDKQLFDNSVFCVLPKDEATSILYLGINYMKENSSFFYLRRFYPEEGEFVKIHKDDLSLLASEKKPAFALIDRPLNEDEVEPLKNYLNSGGTAILLANSPSMQNSLESLMSEKIEIENEVADDYLMWSQLDLKHWLYKPFTESRFKDFSSIFFWKYRKLKLVENSTLKAIASFDNGDPAVLSKSFGRGELLVFSSSWSAEDSQLALNSKFIPLMNAILKSANRFNEKKFQYLCGDSIKLRDGEQLEQTELNGQPGVYDVKKGNKNFKVAMNVPASESKIKQLSNVDFRNAGIAYVDEKDQVEHMTARYKGNESVLKKESRQSHLWRYLIFAALLFICLESITAHFTHKRMDSHEA